MMMKAILFILIMLPALSAPILYFIARKTKLGFPLLTVVCAAEFLCSSALLSSGAASVSFVGINLSAAGFHALYALVTSFAFFVSALFSNEYFRHYDGHARYIFFYLLTLSATEGVFLSSDLKTTFIFFEIVSFCSFVWVLHDGSDAAVSAAKTYLAVAVFGGMALLAGILFLDHCAGTLSISALSPSMNVPYYVGALLLIGFSAKAGMFPLHIWLPKAHPVAPAPASAILSGVLTKVGVYGIIVVTARLFFGDALWGSVLLIFGVITLLLGAVLALLSVDLKRTLACSSMSQIGFIITGIASAATLGEHGALASAGVVLYMLNHSLMKLVLFSLAGVVHMNLHKLNLNDIRGWGRGRPLLAVLFAWCGLGLAGVPLTGGYLAKTLLHEAIVESVEFAAFPAFVRAAEWLFLIGGGCTLAYMIKLFVVIFVEKPAQKFENKRSVNGASALALIIAAAPTAVTGIPAVAKLIAGRGMAFVGVAEWKDVEFFGWECLSGALITAAFGLLIYFLFVRTVTRRRRGERFEYVDPLPAFCDLEKVVYVPAIRALTAVFGFILSIFGENVLTSRICRAFMRVATLVCHAVSDTVDAAVYLLRRTVFRPFVPVEQRRRRHPIVDAVYNNRLTDNFSYSLIVTCVGICIILIFLFIAVRA